MTLCVTCLTGALYDIHHKYTQYNDTLHNNGALNDIQYKDT